MRTICPAPGSENIGCDAVDRLTKEFNILAPIQNVQEDTGRHRIL
jgi:hypothetical protein